MPGMIDGGSILDGREGEEGWINVESFTELQELRMPRHITGRTLNPISALGIVFYTAIASILINSKKCKNNIFLIFLENNELAKGWKCEIAPHSGLRSFSCARLTIHDKDDHVIQPAFWAVIHTYHARCAFLLGPRYACTLFRCRHLSTILPPR